MSAVLELERVNAFYGGAHVLHDVSLAMTDGTLAVVGRNGMGKSTLCNSIMGLVPRVEGRIRYRTQDVSGRKPHQVASVGIGYVPQGRRVFPSLTAEEHLRLTARTRGKWDIDAVYELFPPLALRRLNRGGQLSGGEQQMLAIARVLLRDPSLLILDEPSEGLAPAVSEHLTEVLQRLRDEGVAIFLIEQNLTVASALANRVVVMVNGTVAHNSTMEALMTDVEVQYRLLGV